MPAQATIAITAHDGASSMPSAAQNPLNGGKSGSCTGAVEFSRHETPLCGISTSTRVTNQNKIPGFPENNTASEEEKKLSDSLSDTPHNF